MPAKTTYQTLLPVGYTAKDLISQAFDVETAYRHRSVDDSMLFINGLKIPSAMGPRMFSEVMVDFQRQAFDLILPSLMAVRNGDMPIRRRFWVERTKKAAKDADLACLILWLMAFPKRPILVQVCASHQDQAAILKRRVSDILYYNPWLMERVSVVQNKIKGHNKLGEVVIEATDTTEAAHGETPDLLILNELVHVKKWGVMETHMNNADGVPRGVVIVSTNAGIKGTKADVWRKDAILDTHRWTPLIFDGIAPWIGGDDVKAARKRDPVGAEFARLWRGKWISGRGGAVGEDSIERCFCLPGPSPEPEQGWEYVAGLDLGVNHDHAGVVAVGVNRMKNRMKVAWLRGFEPSVPNDKGVLEVDLMATEEESLRLFRLYRIKWFGYDPAAGGSFMAQRLRRKFGVPMKEMSFSSPINCTKMATAFVLALKDGRLECYDDSEGRLRRDFGKFSIVAKVPSGYKLKAVSDEYGHADVGTALIICLPRAMLDLGGFGGLESEDDLFDGGEETLTKDEMERLPDDLRDIYAASDEDGGIDREPPKLAHFGFDW